MNILVIPFCTKDKSFARAQLLVETLNRKHKLFGVTAGNSIQSKIKAFFAARKILQKKKIDLVFCSLAENAFLGAMLSREFNKPLLFDSHGSISLFSESLKKGIHYRKLFGFFEREAARQASAITTVSERDKKALLMHGIGKEKIFVVPTWIELERIKLQAKKKKHSKQNGNLLFFGTLDYKPNQTALDFINSRLADSLSGIATINVCGSGKPKIAFKSNVKFQGFAKNIVSMIESSDAVIAPVWTGVGILEKALLSMACGKTVITTGFAKKGIPELADGVNAIIARNENDFIKKTMRTLENRQRLERIGKNARKLIEEKYSGKNAKFFLKIAEKAAK